MFKFIPEEFNKDNYSENISHYNFYNLLNNYETILDPSFFNLKHDWSKPILNQLISDLKEKLKEINSVFNTDNQTLEKDYLGTQDYLKSTIKDFDDNISFFENHLDAVFSNKFNNTDIEVRNNLLYHCKPQNKNTPFLTRSNVSILNEDNFLNLNTTARKSSRYTYYLNFKTIVNSTAKYEPKKLYKEEFKNYVFQQYINKTLYYIYDNINNTFRTSKLENIAKACLTDEEAFVKRLEENNESHILNSMFVNWFKQRFVNEEYGYFNSIEEYFEFLDNGQHQKIFNVERNDITFKVYSYQNKEERIHKVAGLFCRYAWLDQYLIWSNLLSFISYSQLATLTNETVHSDMHSDNLIFCKKENDYLRTNKLFFSNFHSNSLFSVDSNISYPNWHYVEEKQTKEKLNKLNYLNPQLSYDNYLASKFNYYSIENNENIYSRFNKDFIDLFGDKIVKVDEDIFCEYSSKEYSFELSVDTKDGSQDISFFLNSNTSHIVNKTSLSYEQIQYLENYFTENGKTRTKVIYCPGLDNKSKKKYPFIQGTTLKTVMTKRGFLLPIKLPFIHLNENNEEQKSWNFCLLNFNENPSYSNNLFDNFAYHMSSDNFRLDRKDDVIFIMTLLKNIFSYDSLILTDPEKYEKLKYSKFDCISQYSQNNAVLFYNAFKNKSIATQNKFIQTFNQGKQLINPTPEKSVLNIFAKVKLDESVQANYNKVKKRYDKVNAKLKSLQEKESEYQELIATLENDIKRFISVVEEKKKRLLTKQQSLKEQKQEIESFRNQYTAISDLMNQKEKEYKQNYELNLKNKNYELNNFLKNISKNNINLSYILFSMKDDPNSLFLYYSKSDYSQVEKFALEDYYYSYYNSEYDHDYNDLVTQMDEDEQYAFEDDNVHALQSLLQNNNYCIKKVCFTTIKPSLIKIDNKEKYVVGGPYRITVTDDAIRIGLLNFSSVMGIDSINKPQNFKPHPHSNSTSLYDILNRPREALLKPLSACLGEASSIIYHSFKENDLSRILLSTMIWVKSANSADVWGKTYKWFPEPNDVDLEFDALSDLPTSSEINSFIDSELQEIEVIEVEEPAEEDIFRMEAEELEQEEQEQIEEETNNQQGIEAFNTNDTYVRYTRT